MEQRRGTLTAAPKEGERKPGLRAIGGTAARLVAPIVRRHGGGVLARLKMAWSDIAGTEFAATAWPVALGRDGALKLRVEPSRALELQHRAPLLIGRINMFFGRDAVIRVMLVQGPLPFAAAGGGTPAGRAPPPAAATPPAAAEIAAIADPELRAALAALGRLVAGRLSEE